MAAPTVTTQTPTFIGKISAVGAGTITATGGTNATSVGFEWDTNTGAPYANSVSEAGSYGAVSFNVPTITGLPPGTLIYYRAFATNPDGTGYGSEVTFTTVEGIVTTKAMTSIAATTATGNGTIQTLGGLTISEHGHCWDTTVNPTASDSGSGKWGRTTKGAGAVGDFTSALTVLTDRTTYYCRAYVTDSLSVTHYGANVKFTAGFPSMQVTPREIAIDEDWFRYVDAYGVIRYVHGNLSKIVTNFFSTPTLATIWRSAKTPTMISVSKTFGASLTERTPATDAPTKAWS